VAHDWRAALLVFVIGGISFTIVRNRTTGRIGVLIIFPFILALLAPQDLARVVAAMALSALVAWIYQKIPDDLDLPQGKARQNLNLCFVFFEAIAPSFL
jgi:hypothetical protein